MTQIVAATILLTADVLRTNIVLPNSVFSLARLPSGIARNLNSNLSRMGHFMKRRTQSRCLTAAIAAVLFLLLPKHGDAGPVPTPYVAVANYSGGQVLRYNASNGAYLGTIGSLPGPLSEFILGPDGFFYATQYSYSDQFKIYRINSVTGATSQFVDATGMGGIRGMAFGPNGDLFVAAQGKNAILEFDGKSGQYVGDFITGIADPIDIDFAPDGTLYVARGHHQISNPSSILRYDGYDGSYLGVFATAQVDTPQDIIVGSNGDVYVTNQWYSAQPLVGFNGATGAVKFAVAGDLSNPQGMSFGNNGELLVASWDDTIKRFDPSSGKLLGNLISDGFLSEPIGVAYVPEPSAVRLAGIAILFVFARFVQKRR